MSATRLPVSRIARPRLREGCGPAGAGRGAPADDDPDRVPNTKSPESRYLDRCLCRAKIRANLLGIETVRADASVFIGRRFPRQSTCEANSTSASSTSLIRTLPQRSASNPEKPAPVRAATGEQCAMRLIGGGDGPLELTSLKEPRADAVRWPRSFGREHHGRRVRSGPAKPASRVAVDPIRDPGDDHDRRLGNPLTPQLAHMACKTVRRDCIEPPRREAREHMPVHGIAVAVSRCCRLGYFPI
jgi:hypothetical protein